MGKGFTSTILLYLFLFSSCNFLNTTKDSEYLIEKLSLTQFDNNGTAINVIAHRGASFEYPENTLLAFEKAIEHYTDFVELDIFFTKDNIPVVVHDDSLSRTTNGTGFIKDFTFRELSKLDAGSWLNPDFSNETIPSLEQVLDSVKSRVGLIIEIKTSYQRPNPTTTELITIIDLIHQKELKNNVIISSFSSSVLEMVYDINPKINICKIFNQDVTKDDINLELYHRNKFDFIMLHRNSAKLYDPEKISLTRQRKIIFYGIYNTSNFNEVSDYTGQFGFVTNQPKLFIK